jgi:hypothetical protein
MGPSSWSPIGYDGAAESTETSRESTRDLEHGSLLNSSIVKIPPKRYSGVSKCQSIGSH